MCGIVGIISDNNTKSIKPCIEAINHRGPDDSGYMIDRKIALGHTRLSIIELSRLGHQPMQSNNGNLIVIFNGEIYNHKEIRGKIGSRYKFKSLSDTETLIAGYQVYGKNIIEQLNGIFAFSIYDKSKNKLIISRDQMGVKPLYYYFDDKDFFFASEIKSFLKIPGWDKSIDYSAVMNYLHFMYSPGEQTPFKFIKKFPPGHLLEINVDNISELKFEKYYQIPFSGKYFHNEIRECVQEVDEALTKAIERQLMSDVPVGFFLSGGLDSSLIVAKAREIKEGEIKCFTIASDQDKVSKEGFTDDLFYARRVAKHLNVELIEIDGGINIIEDFDKMIWHLDEPQSDIAPIHVLNIASVARESGYKVLLGGAGGDDLFSGYRRHQALNYENLIKWTPNFIWKAINMLISFSSLNYPYLRRIKKILEKSSSDELERISGYFSWIPLESNFNLFSSEVQSKIKGYNPNDILIDSLSSIPFENNNLNKMLFWEMKYFLTDHNLNYTDKMSMAKGVEARVPYLDIDLVNISTDIHPSIKLNGNKTKFILKKISENYLPHDVINRPKAGFGGPIRNWITKDLEDMIQDYLSPINIEQRGIFNSNSIWQLINDNKAGKIDGSYNIWCLLAIESWFRQFYDS